MGSAFIFDLMNIIGKTLDTLIKNGQWNEVNYTDCFNFTSTDMTAWTQATHFRKQILQASFKTIFKMPSVVFLTDQLFSEY